MKAWRACQCGGKYTNVVSLIASIGIALSLIQVYHSIQRIEVELHSHHAEVTAPGKTFNNIKNMPTIIDWHSHSVLPNEHGYDRQCGNQNRCYFTRDRHRLDDSNTQAIMFYGTDFSLKDLPLPRLPQHMWILQHEESPKNNILFSYKGTMELFNITSTFRQESHYPIATQYLRSIEQLEDTTWMKSHQQKNRYAEKDGLASVLYVHSDCDVPSDRDNLIQMLMKYLKIDSYGICLHNKDLPKQYKFAFAFENAICNDYITEKFWRPLAVGTVPIVLGSPNIQEFSPDNHSIINVNDFQSVQQLVDHITKVGKDEGLYESYRTFKRKGVSNENLLYTMRKRQWDTDFDVQQNTHASRGSYPHHFECFVCDSIHDVLSSGKAFHASKNHYGCPLPMRYANENSLNKKIPHEKLWFGVWRTQLLEQQAFLQLSKGGRYSYNTDKLSEKAMSEYRRYSSNELLIDMFNKNEV